METDLNIIFNIIIRLPLRIEVKNEIRYLIKKVEKFSKDLKLQITMKEE